MKNIFKYFLVALVAAFVITACDDEANRDWTTPEASFKLYDTTLGANILYETMKENPFILTWDNTKSSSAGYSVVVSATEDFVNKVELGKSETNTYKTSIGALNTAMLQVGLSPYSSQAVFLRIESGSEVSNAIRFVVTVYPTAGPIVTAPTAGSALVLNSADQSAIATTFTWNDYSNYGVDVKYLVEVAKKGATTFTSLGEVTNVKTLAVTNKDLNTAIVNAGAIMSQANDIDVRVTASTTSTGGSIVLKSAIVTFKVTPYQIDYPNFFLVGGASAIGWTPSDAINLYKHDNISEIYTYLQPENFRFLGQKDWNGFNYSIDLPTTDADKRYFKTVSSNVSFGDHENMKFTGAAGIYKVVIDADFGVKSLTVTPTTVSWDIPNLYLVGSVQSPAWTPASALPFQVKGNGVFESDPIQIQDGAEFKFLGQQDWSGKEWGNIHTAGNTGFLGPNNDNNNIKFDGGGNYYIITVDLKRGTYKLVKL